MSDGGRLEIDPKPCAFIHTNHKQILGAIVGAHSIRRASSHNDEFDVRTIEHVDYPFFREHENKSFRRDGISRSWHNEDLQSFTPLRFMPPELMGYRGRALVIDPDVFAVGDVWELLSRDMQGKAILCRPRDRKSRSVEGRMATSVMLLDCSKLRHWRVEEQFRSMFTGAVDYKDWITLRNEPRDSIGLFENAWNDLDRLDRDTRMLHTTKRWTQPWKTGLPIDFTPADKFRRFPPLGWMLWTRRKLLGDHSLLGHYRQHPDPHQEALFFGLLRECLEEGLVDEKFIRKQMAAKHVREDAIEMVAKAASPDETLAKLDRAA